MNLSTRSRPVRGVLLAAGATLLLAGPAGCSEDRQTVASWSQHGGQTHVNAIGADVKTLLDVSGRGDDPTIASRCRQVLADVNAAKSYGKLPDSSAESSWEETLDRAQAAASHCLDNVKAGNGGSLADAMEVETAFRGFVRDFGAATGRS
ncbi:hypothetical protein [Streptacidiphilus rugosus]|uniref:hypothetical protein n=1 Tax=Streptacidiphilus rugosus TaxID=405783 RepID=UPI00055C5F6E|nr:hypothetical protein [Streptacidiphilus rugosus]